MAIEPSPTAEATRFTLPERTSPTADTPGRLVSSIAEAPEAGYLRRFNEVSSSQDEAFVVQRQTALQPVCSWRGSRHDEHMADVMN